LFGMEKMDTYAQGLVLKQSTHAPRSDPVQQRTLGKLVCRGAGNVLMWFAAVAPVGRPTFLRQTLWCHVDAAGSPDDARKAPAKFSSSCAAATMSWALSCLPNSKTEIHSPWGRVFFC